MIIKQVNEKKNEGADVLHGLFTDFQINCALVFLVIEIIRKRQR